jgi:aspartyl aminopeptidase
MAKKSKYEKLQKEVALKKESAWQSTDEKAVQQFGEGYKKFLFKAKTERESVKEITKILKKDGFKNITSLNTLKKGDKVYKNIKNRAILCGVIGKETDILRIAGSHIDSPRLDLKPNPMYEDSGLCLFKSHYYGGIKKYHWVNIPLAMHATIHTKKGIKEFTYGESEDEAKFIIPDLLIHLSRDQMDKKAREAITGENLHIILGNQPIKDEKVNEKIKLRVLEILNKKYGIIEKDFLSADIQFVPAGKPMDIGLDNSMIAAYAQDDHVCAYTSLKAMLAVKDPKHTMICVFADKEEIGSYGNTGAQSRMLQYFVMDILALLKSRTRITQVFEQSCALSCDVTAGVNPAHKEVHDISNASFLGHGVSIEKYGGHGGKYSTSEASSEFMRWFVDILDKKGISWQTGEVGKIDTGGGGTIGMYMAHFGLDVIDVGPCVLAMHSTCEVTSKVDVYEAYRAYKAFFEN